MSATGTPIRAIDGGTASGIRWIIGSDTMSHAANIPPRPIASQISPDSSRTPDMPIPDRGGSSGQGGRSTPLSRAVNRSRCTMARC